MDKFQNISDFSRAYGALCWNLAKVIPFKDIPYVPRQRKLTTQNNTVDKCRLYSHAAIESPVC